MLQLIINTTYLSVIQFMCNSKRVTQTIGFAVCLLLSSLFLFLNYLYTSFDSCLTLQSEKYR